MNYDVPAAVLEGYARFAATHGMSQAVLIELLGMHINDPDLFQQRALERLAVEGRELTAERRRKGGPRPKA